MRDLRVGDSGFASHLEDHKLLYVSLEKLLLTISRRSRTPWVQLLRKGGQVCEKTNYMFGFSKETSHLDGSFEYPEEVQMIFFKIRKLTSPNDISNH